MYLWQFILLVCFLKAAIVVEAKIPNNVFFSKIDAPKLSQPNAAASCEQQGGILARVYDANENAFIKAWDLAQDYWFGLTIDPTTKVSNFSDGTSPDQTDTKTFWAKGQPDGSSFCGQYDYAAGSMWDDAASCGLKKGYICEFGTQPAGLTCSGYLRWGYETLQK